MSSSNELPAKCTECYKSAVTCFHRKCLICNELKFEESILCNLNRSVQKITDFQCHAFQPILKLVGPLAANATGGDNFSTEKKPQDFLAEHLKSELKRNIW